jgi:hypothetical protein
VAAKEVAVKKYVVRLSVDERAQFNDLIHKGKRSAQLLKKARILLKADASEAGDHRADSEKNILKPHLKQQWVIAPDDSAPFVANMEDVLSYSSACQGDRICVGSIVLYSFGSFVAALASVTP